MRQGIHSHHVDTRSYAFLVERVLPTHRLARSRRTGLELAFVADEPQALFNESVAALADLEAQGIFEELPPPRPGARLFRHRGRGDRLLLEAPSAVSLQASRLAGPALPTTVDQGRDKPQAKVADAGAFSPPPEFWSPESTTGVNPSGGAAGAAAATEPPWTAGPAGAELAVGPPEPALEAVAGPAGLPDATSFLDPFLELASIEAQLEPFGDRLRRIALQLETALPGATVKLLVLDAESAEQLGDGAVQLLDQAAAQDVPHYREALRQGETQFATSAPVGADPSSGRIAAAVPLYVGGAPWGLLRVTWERGSVASLPELARLLTPLARLVAVAIQNQTMLEKLVFVDPLTGVYNRAFYDRQVTLEIERANRTNQKLALLVMDVDDFKPINDQYGHRAGDQVLSQLAREVRARMRKIDLMFRYGGEEFVLLLPGADLEEAQRTAERLRAVVAEQRYAPESAPAPLRVTVSVGGAVYPDQSRTKTGLFNAADSALYRAKSEGKNRIAF